MRLKGRDTPADGAFTLISGKAINLPEVFDIENDSTTERQQYSVRHVCLACVGFCVLATCLPLPRGCLRPCEAYICAYVQDVLPQKPQSPQAFFRWVGPGGKGRVRRDTVTLQPEDGS